MTKCHPSIYSNCYSNIIPPAGLDYVPLLGSSPQLSFSGSSTSESVLVNVVADDLEEETEFFEVILSGVEVRDASGMKLVLSHKDQGRIILGQKQARIFILDGNLLYTSALEHCIKLKRS